MSGKRVQIYLRPDAIQALEGVENVSGYLQHLAVDAVCRWQTGLSIALNRGFAARELCAAVRLLASVEDWPGRSSVTFALHLEAARVPPEVDPAEWARLIKALRPTSILEVIRIAHDSPRFQELLIEAEVAARIAVDLNEALLHLSQEVQLGNEAVFEKLKDLIAES